MQADEPHPVVYDPAVDGICFECAHYGPAGRCAAFPNGIPTDILIGRIDHRRPFNGDGYWSDDRDVQFTPDDDGDDG